jgi:protease-4
LEFYHCWICKKNIVAKLNEIANGLLARSWNGKSSKLVDIVAYEDVYHWCYQALKVKNDERYNKVSVVDYAQKLVATSQSFDSTDEIAIII